MKRFIELESLTTISRCLSALAEITADIESMKLQLEYPASYADADWPRRATYALKHCQRIKTCITSRLAVLRQQEKERNIALNQRRNDYLVKELMKYVPEVVVKLCNARATIKSEAANGN